MASFPLSPRVALTLTLGLDILPFQGNNVFTPKGLDMLGFGNNTQPNIFTLKGLHIITQGNHPGKRIRVL